LTVTGVQTCALPILAATPLPAGVVEYRGTRFGWFDPVSFGPSGEAAFGDPTSEVRRSVDEGLWAGRGGRLTHWPCDPCDSSEYRSEERRVGKRGRDQ